MGALRVRGLVLEHVSRRSGKGSSEPFLFAWWEFAWARLGGRSACPGACLVYARERAWVARGRRSPGSGSSCLACLLSWLCLARDPRSSSPGSVLAVCDPRAVIRDPRASILASLFVSCSSARMACFLGFARIDLSAVVRDPGCAICSPGSAIRCSRCVGRASSTRPRGSRSARPGARGARPGSWLAVNSLTYIGNSLRAAAPKKRPAS